MTNLLRTIKSNRRGLAAGLILGVSTVTIAGFVSRAARADDADLVKRGEYLTTMGDCVACHTAPGGEKFAGGLYMKTPVGSLPTPNLTPDKETGIGNWSDDQFYRALHEGINAKGEYLYPAFPFPWFTKVKKEDVLAIKAYLFSLKPVHAPTKENKIAFPFDIRTGLLTWRTLFFKPGTFEPDPKASDEINRGAYIVEGLEHCGECHNKSKLMGASVWSGKLEGGKIEGFYAPNITPDHKQGVGLWSKDDIVTYLKTGSKPDHSSVAEGPMKETIHDSLSHLSDQDLGAIAAYLKSLAAKQTVTASDSSAGKALPVLAPDAYLAHCASCHQRDGKGIKNAIPPLAGNGSVTAKGPENVIRAVLGGLEASHGLAPMPALGQTMTDEEVAQAANYVRSNWGNAAPADVTAGEVHELRSKTKTLLAVNDPSACKPNKDEPKPDPKITEAIDGDVKGKLEAMSTSDMLTTIDAILPGLKQKAPGADTNQITNSLTTAYCPIVQEKVPGDEKSVVLGNFATLVYGQARKNGKPN